MNFRITNDGNQSDRKEIKDMLEAYNTAHGAKSELTPVAVYYEDEKGLKKAGVTGHVFGNWLFIEFLFVSEELRGLGIGQKLLALAEENAKSLGAKFAYVTTNGFQAPGFYTKMGYENVFVMDEFPLTGKKYHYTKKI